MRGLVLCLLIAVASPAFAQHLGARVQWQPETMQADARLQQSVEIKIIGRAAVPALKLLSDATGVSLGVAPENLNTVGERKLTIISEGLTLKAIMVQIPQALQEAHWDIDASGEQPVYMLHRNAGLEAAATDEWPKPRFIPSPDRQQRADRIEDARRALVMSSGELGKLEKTDLFLARAVRHPEARALMQSLLALPQERMEELVSTGRTRFNYADAPPALRQAARLVIALQRRWVDWARAWPPDIGPLEEFDPTNTAAQLAGLQQDLDSDSEVVVLFHFSAFQGAVMSLVGPGGSTGQTVVPARPPMLSNSGSYYEFLLVETGDDLSSAKETIDRLTTDWVKRQDALEWDENESTWAEPADPRLHEVLEFPANSDQVIALSDAQRAISDRTGLSVISDYFIDDTIGLSPNQPALGGPLWHDLYILGYLGQFTWQQAGDCLVFHRTHWYQWTQREVPESLIADYMGRMERQGHLTLGDVAELAAALTLRPGGGVGGGFILPARLHDAGASQAAYPRYRWALLLWRALSPNERAAAEGEQGLRFADLSGRRAAVLAGPVQLRPPGDQPAAQETMRTGVFHVRRSDGVDEQGSYVRYDFAIEFPDSLREPMTTQVVLYEVKPLPKVTQ